MSSDAAVIEASLGEPGRFAAIFDRHGPHIHRYLARRLGREAADDLVGDTFLIAFDKRGKYDLARPDARPWLYGIATNLVSQYWRDQGKQARLRLVTGPEPVQDGHADRVAEQVTAEAMGDVLTQALNTLSEGDRDVLVLIATEGLAYDEVAAALDIPVGTVRSRMFRARKKVRASLGLTTSEEISQHG
ncbi:RNA polymerase sigma factor [Amycolatopsis sp. cg5]|uniref:RNA polymerase sigma factor n=1 Tax=Amycolatopsis sp. cg5 TaxID=3238802 RepID=UPI0035253349